MAKYLFLSVFVLIGFSSYTQLYKPPGYPQYYFRWPTDLKPDIVANMGELRSNHWHMGLDVRTDAQVNKRVLAAADGYISFVGIKPFGFGRWIIITHTNGLSTLYCHLNNFEPKLEAYVTEQQYKNESWETELEIPKGKFPVKKGDFISYSGTTGGSQGPHIHFEIIDNKSDRRLNPTLFGTPIADNIPPSVSRLAMYDRDNSTYYQSPIFFALTKKTGFYSVKGDTIFTNIKTPGFAIQAYDTRNGTANQDGIFSARLFFDGKEISSFYIDSIGYDETRYMNAHIDYKLKYNGGAYLQHLSPLPGDKGGVYYTLENGLFELEDTLTHQVKIIVGDANKNTSEINFNIRKTDEREMAAPVYEWQPNRLNRLFKYDFEAYLPMNALYDKMNSGYTRSPSFSANSVSAIHKLGENYIPVQQVYEVRIKPDKNISKENKDRIVIKRTAKKSEVKKAEWNNGWLTAQFKEFGTFEAFVDNVPPTIPSLGAGVVVNLTKASRMTFTPTDDFEVASFRAEVDGKWLRFTNDKGKTWVYNFDSRIDTGIHTLSVSVTDVAGNETTRSWKFRRGGAYSASSKTISGAKYNSEGEGDDSEDIASKPIVEKKAANAKNKKLTKTPSKTKVLENKKKTIETKKAVAGKKK